MDPLSSVLTEGPDDFEDGNSSQNLSAEQRSGVLSSFGFAGNENSATLKSLSNSENNASQADIRVEDSSSEFGEESLKMKKTLVSETPLRKAHSDGVLVPPTPAPPLAHQEVTPPAPSITEWRGGAHAFA